MRTFLRIWRGDDGLLRAFWIWLVVGDLAIVAVQTSAPYQLAVPDRAKLIVGLLGIGYMIVASVGTWRSAGRYEGFWLWEILARCTVVGLVIALLLALFAG